MKITGCDPWVKKGLKGGCVICPALAVVLLTKAPVLQRSETLSDWNVHDKGTQRLVTRTLNMAGL